jgi:hypothetical protein
MSTRKLCAKWSPRLLVLVVVAGLWAASEAAASYRGTAYVVQLSQGAGSYQTSASAFLTCDSWSYSDHANFTFHTRFPRVLVAPAIRSVVDGAVGAPTGSMDGTFAFTDNFHGGCPGDSPSSITCPGEVSPTETAGGPAPLTTGAEFHFRGTGNGIEVEVSPSEWASGNDTPESCPSLDQWNGNNGLGAPFMGLDGRFLPNFGTAWNYTYDGAHVHIPLRLLRKRSFEVSVGITSTHENIPSGDIPALNECNVHGYGNSCSIAFSWHAKLTFTRVCAASIALSTVTLDTTDVKEKRAQGTCV